MCFFLFLELTLQSSGWGLFMCWWTWFTPRSLEHVTCAGLDSSSYHLNWLKVEENSSFVSCVWASQTQVCPPPSAMRSPTAALQLQKLLKLLWKGKPVKDLSAGKSRGNDTLNSPMCVFTSVCALHNMLPPLHLLANFCLASFASRWRSWLNIKSMEYFPLASGVTQPCNLR